MCVTVSWTAISECSACNNSPVAAVVSLQSRWLGTLWRCRHWNQDRDVEQVTPVLTLDVRAGLGSWFESWWSWDGLDERSQQKWQRFARWRWEGPGGFSCCYFDLLQRKTVKPKSIQWYVNYMKTQRTRGVTTEKAPPKLTELPLHITWANCKGVGRGPGRREGALPTSFWKREKKKSNIFGAQVCLFVSKKILQKLCF